MGVGRLRNLLGTPFLLWDSGTPTPPRLPHPTRSAFTRLSFRTRAHPLLDSGTPGCILSRSPGKGLTVPLREGRPRAGPLGLSKARLSPESPGFRLRPEPDRVHRPQSPADAANCRPYSSKLLVQVRWRFLNFPPFTVCAPPTCRACLRRQLDHT